MLEVTYDDKEVRIALRKLDKNLKEVEEPLIKSADYMKTQAMTNFPAMGQAMGERWPGLRESTKKYKEKHFSGKPMMVRTGTLKNSFDNTEPLTTENQAEIEVFSPVYYAKYHQTGTSKMPRRVLLKIIKAHAQRIKKIFELWLDRAISQSTD